MSGYKFQIIIVFFSLKIIFVKAKSAEPNERLHHGLLILFVKVHVSIWESEVLKGLEPLETFGDQWSFS